MNLANEILDSASTAPLIGGANVADVQSAQATPTSPWYALYTCPRHEKCVAQQIEQRRIDCFLPLYRSVRRWKDRRKELELALFPGYVFVRLAAEDRLRVLQLPSAVRLVSFNGQPAPLPEAEIEALRQRLASGARIEPPRPASGAGEAAGSEADDAEERDGGVGRCWAPGRCSRSSFLRAFRPRSR